MSDQPVSAFQRPFNQICFYVKDMEKAAQAWHDLTGAGPFYLMHHIGFKKLTYNGEEATLDQSSACGNWGSIQIELFEQHDDSPAGMGPLLPAFGNPDLGVLHHLNFVADDLEEEIKRIEALGYPAIWRCEVDFPGPDPFLIAMFDTRPLTGCMTEVYKRHEGVEGLYDLIRQASIGWDGNNLLREPTDLTMPGMEVMSQ